MANVNIKAEVESVIGRELIGHEKAIVITLFRLGMMNPIDIARSMYQQHLENATRTRDHYQSEIHSLENALARLPK